MNRDKVYRNSLITCTVMLIVCIILKLFGVPWFDLNTGIPLLKEIDEMVSNNNSLLFIVTLSLRTINSMLMTCLIVKDISEVVKKTWIFVLFAISSMMLNLMNINGLLTFFWDIISLLILNLLILKTGSFKEVALCFGLNILYQIVSLTIKNLGVIIGYYGLIENILFSLDYYVMLVITYLYLKKGDITLCGVMVHISLFLRKQLCTMRSKGLKHYLTNKKESD